MAPLPLTCPFSWIPLSSLPGLIRAIHSLSPPTCCTVTASMPGSSPGMTIKLLHRSRPSRSASPRSRAKGYQRARTAGHRSAASVAQIGQPFGAPLIRRYFRPMPCALPLFPPRSNTRKIRPGHSSPGRQRVRTPEAGPLSGRQWSGLAICLGPLVSAGTSGAAPLIPRHRRSAARVLMDEGWGKCNAASGGGDKWGHRTHHSLLRRLLHTSPLRGGPTTPTAASGWGHSLTPPGAPGSSPGSPPSPSRGGMESVAPLRQDIHLVLSAKNRTYGRRGNRTTLFRSTLSAAYFSPVFQADFRSRTEEYAWDIACF